MKDIYYVVKHNPLWANIEFDDFQSIIHCMKARTKNFSKNEPVILSGEKINSIGLIISGSVKLIKEDIEGNIAIITELSAPEVFGEVFVCAGIDHSPITIQAVNKCEILFLNYKKVVTSCSSSCSFHAKLIENMLRLIAQNNLALNQKIAILSMRSTREKLLAFFEMQRGMANQFTIPFSREEMAQYLCVDRSAMSNELGRMRDEGMIVFKKNMFEIL